MKINICLLHTDPFHPEHPARPAITEIYSRYFPSFGHKVIWIATSDQKGKKVKNIFFKKIQVYTIPYPLSTSLSSKILNIILFYIREFKLLYTILKKEHIDIIQVRNDIFSSILVLIIKIRFNVIFVFQYSYPKESYKFKKNKKFHSRYFGIIENFLIDYILKKADFIFPISKWMSKELTEKGIQESKMMVLPLGGNPYLFSSHKGDLNVYEKYNLENSRVILYIGSMSHLRQLDIVIRAFSKIKKQENNCKLLMVGDGDDRINLEKLSKELGLQNDIIFTGEVPYYNVPFFIDASNICLCPVPPLPIYKVSSPTKLFEYMMLKKPVIANEEIPEQNEVINESGGGILVKFEDVSFANGMVELLNNHTSAEEMGKKGYEWIKKNRFYDNLARKVEKKYFELLEDCRKNKL
jgi:glycosyltransferase involved in cell wall biosynthesis